MYLLPCPCAFSRHGAVVRDCSKQLRQSACSYHAEFSDSPATAPCFFQLWALFWLELSLAIPCQIKILQKPQIDIVAASAKAVEPRLRFGVPASGKC